MCMFIVVIIKGDYLTLEFILHNLLQTQNTVTYTEQHYDVKHNLVSFRFSPRTHSPSAIFFARFIMSTTFPNEAFNIVHDFETQLQYTINER